MSPEKSPEKPSPGGKAAPNRWLEGLSAEMSLLDALELIFRQRWDGPLYYLPRAAGQPDDVEHVHKLRVSSRRLSAVLDMLVEDFPAAPRKRMRKLARKIRRRCGQARNLDVRRQFLEALLPHASVEDAAVIELLCEQTEHRRTAAQKKLRRGLPRLERRLRRRGVELLESFETMKVRPTDYGSFGQRGAHNLLTEMLALWTRADAEMAAGAGLHQLRIACKHLRYAFEVFLPIFPSDFREDFFPQLEHIQFLLGEIHDATQATQALRRQRKKWKRSRNSSKWAASGLATFNWPLLRAGLDAVLLAYAQQADQARTEFLELWPAFAGASFRVPVEEALAVLAGDQLTRANSAAAPAATGGALEPHNGSVPTASTATAGDEARLALARGDT